MQILAPLLCLALGFFCYQLGKAHGVKQATELFYPVEQVVDFNGNPYIIPKGIRTEFFACNKAIIAEPNPWEKFKLIGRLVEQFGEYALGEDFHPTVYARKHD